MTDFFDLPDDAFGKTGKGTPREKKVDPNVYYPDPNDYNGSYKSVFRFVQYIFDKSKTKYTKYSAKIWNPLTKESIIVDCPSNVGQPSILWTVELVLKQLKKEEPELHEELSKNFSRWYTHHSIVYIKKDPQRPDLENTLKVFKFRNQVDQLIEQQRNPEQIDDLTPIKKINPYHLLEGKDFLCIVGKKTKEFRDWSKCKFMDEITPFIFKVGDKLVKVENNEKSVKLVSEYLTKYSPKLDEYYHQEWTDETYNKVAEAIVGAISNRNVLNMILEKSKDDKINSLIKSKLTKSKTNNPIESEDSVSFKSTTTPDKKEEKSSKKEEVREAPTASTGSDEYDELFKDL